MGSTVGIHLIWTCKGTWMPGDARGHWSPLFDLYGRLRAAGHRLQMPDEVTYQHAMALMKDPPKALANDEFDIVATALAKCLFPNVDVDGHALPKAYACAIEPTHVHLLVGTVREDIERFVGRLKGTSSSAVLNHPDSWDRKSTWTAGIGRSFCLIWMQCAPSRGTSTRTTSGAACRRRRIRG